MILAAKKESNETRPSVIMDGEVTKDATLSMLMVGAGACAMTEAMTTVVEAMAIIATISTTIDNENWKEGPIAWACN